MSKGRGSQGKLYELEVVERDRANCRVKVHYIGYDSDDEWCSESNVKIVYPVQGKLCSKICIRGLVTVHAGDIVYSKLSPWNAVLGILCHIVSFKFKSFVVQKYQFYTHHRSYDSIAAFVTHCLIIQRRPSEFEHTLILSLI